MKKLLCSAALAVALSGCAAPQQPNADLETLQQAAFQASDGPALTVITVVNNRTGQGGHTALMVSGSERVIFDPAGSFHADVVPEYNDVLYGISPAVFQAYRSAHARTTFHVVTQRIPVSAEQAEVALQLVKSNGRVPGAFCANATSGILQQVPGFEDIDRTFYPVKLFDQIAERPGVKAEKYYEGDDEDLKRGIAASNAALNG
ncbi:hypothetical protein SAMN04488118_101188 [Epibacterium ulvae]|uniref:Lipoprotein n=1 Tax=Epibacterium ulvae TaxID=1156985 RepID=A0A1G5PKN8_9RHOB|nr:hypothetical protein [Epibacterium ulvae]SCZ49926.1 hypothetical protein SAMN04488118_101188 [Epibacterium ulvae]